MSKDDFRDRIRSYSLEPEKGDWVKMQQLLDADKDDRKGIAWWKFGALFALLLIPASIYLMSNVYSEPVLGKSSIVNLSTQNTDKHSTTNEKVIRSQVEKSAGSTGESAAQADINETLTTTSVNTIEDSPEKTSSSDKTKSTNNKISNSKINTSNKKSSKSNFNIKKKEKVNPNFSLPRAYNSSQSKTSSQQKSEAVISNEKVNKQLLDVGLNEISELAFKSVS